MCDYWWIHSLLYTVRLWITTNSCIKCYNLTHVSRWTDVCTMTAHEFPVQCGKICSTCSVNKCSLLAFCLFKDFTVFSAILSAAVVTAAAAAERLMFEFCFHHLYIWACAYWKSLNLAFYISRCDFWILIFILKYGTVFTKLFFEFPLDVKTRSL